MDVWKMKFIQRVDHVLLCVLDKKNSPVSSQKYSRRLVIFGTWYHTQIRDNDNRHIYNYK